MQKRQWILIAALLAALPMASANGADTPVESFEGRLEIVRADNFTTGISTTTHTLRTATTGDPSGALHLIFPEGFKVETLRTGDAVTVQGRRTGNEIHVQILLPLAPHYTASNAGDVRQLPEVAAAIEDRRAVIIIVDMLDAVNSLTVGDVTGLMYEDDKNVNGLFKASSFQQLGFNPDTDNDDEPDIFGPFTINYNAADGCNYAAWASAADAAAQAAGIDLSIYQHKVYALPTAVNCAWSGLGTVGCGYYCAVWVKEGGGPVLAHELGHNLSWYHAGTDPENDGTINSEYGDHSGIMGWPRWSQANAPHRDQKQWFDAFPGMLQLAQTSGVFELDALELDPGVDEVAAQVIKIPKADTNEYYYLSYRRQVGGYPVYWPYADKVNIHYNGGMGDSTAHIVNLDQGETFTDSANDIVVTATSAGGTTATVTVTIGGAPLNTTPAANFSVDIDNLSVQFSDNSSDSDGTITSRSWDFGDGTTSALTQPTHTYASPGIYLVRLAVTDNDGGIGVASRHVATNQLPLVQFEATANQLEVTFDSTCSDSDGTIQSYLWDFGDGTGSAEYDPVHTYAERSAYTVSLTVRDNDGGSTTVSDVINLAPSVAAAKGSGSGGGGSSSGGCFIHGVLQ